LLNTVKAAGIWAELEFKYSEDQPRGEGGRWVGGEGASGVAAPEQADRPQAREIEQEIDQAVKDPNVDAGQQKDAVAKSLVARLKDNPAWKEYVASGSHNRLIAQMWAKHEDGGTYAAASILVANWAGSSGDHDEDGVLMQRAINDEFKLDAKTDHMVFHEGDNQARVDRLYEQNGAGLRAFARAMYDNTQEQLKDAGVDRVLLYRGMSFGNATQAGNAGFVAQNPRAGRAFETRTATVAEQPASSWSYNPDVAVHFSQSADVSTVMAAEVPASRILSTSRTGFGARGEDEVVVLGTSSDQVNHLTGTETITANDVRVNIFQPGSRPFKTLVQLEAERKETWHPKTVYEQMREDAKRDEVLIERVRQFRLERFFAQDDV
jgi:hypothetical protein